MKCNMGLVRIVAMLAVLAVSVHCKKKEQAPEPAVGAVGPASADDEKLAQAEPSESGQQAATPAAPGASVGRRMGRGSMSKGEEEGRTLEDLGLTPLGTDELWVIAKNEDQPVPPSEGPKEPPALKAKRPGSEEEIPLPLQQTDVRAKIVAYIASVEVEQKYHNPYDEKIEVVYVFPLPQDAAVSDFLMKVGERTIRGVIREREEAERIYNEARAQGFVASLLTQERPNIFTQKVANIEPNADIDIQLTYYNTLPYRDGAYEFGFPTVVGPRFNPAGTTDGVGAVPRGQTGTSGQATEVQYLAPGESGGALFSMTVDLEAGVKVTDVRSTSHAIQVEDVSADHKRITLRQGAELPNKDFVLRYAVAGEAVKSGFLLHRDERGGFFTMVLTPPADLAAVGRAPVEHVFVLDCSGSMSGTPLDLSKAAVRRVLEKLQPTDTFQIIQFSMGADTLGPAPIPATPDNVRRGLEYLAGLQSEGGTMMIEGIKAALDFPHEEGKVRLVSFLTDGYIGNESEILAAIHEKLGASRIFSFGIGSSPNTFLLERMAKLGQGAVAYVMGGDTSADEAAVDAFYDRIAHPAFSDVEVDWRGMQVSDVFPSRLPDLWGGRPVVITGRITGDAVPNITVHGRIAGQPASIEVPIAADAAAQRPAIAQIWARMKILDIADRSLWAAQPDELYDQIKRVALEYSLMSKFTAFVAVDSSRVTEGDHGVTVVQPVPVPAGVQYDTTVGNPNRPGGAPGEGATQPQPSPDPRNEPAPSVPTTAPAPPPPGA